VLDHALTPVSSTAAARSWIDSFPDAPLLAAFDMLPAVIYPAAATARSETAAPAPTRSSRPSTGAG
jgi:hypothetical protein